MLCASRVRRLGCPVARQPHEKVCEKCAAMRIRNVPVRNGQEQLAESLSFVRHSVLPTLPRIGSGDLRRGERRSRMRSVEGVWRLAADAVVSTWLSLPGVLPLSIWRRGGLRRTLMPTGRSALASGFADPNRLTQSCCRGPTPTGGMTAPSSCVRRLVDFKKNSANSDLLVSGA